MSKQTTKDWQKVRDALDENELNEVKEEALEGDETEKALEYPSHEALEAELLAAEKKAEENMEKALRATAELDNVRRRAEREVANAHRFGVEKLIKELLPVMDSLEQALLAVDTAAHPEMVQGIELTIKLLMSALEKHDVTQLNPEGQPFNPQEHEAMSVQPSDEVAPNTVMMVMQKGYKLSDRVVRPARVIVSKATS